MQSQIEKKKKKHPKEKLVGKTLCKKIHARTLEERVEVTFNEDFQPIGPSEKECQMIIKNRFWRYTNRKFILRLKHEIGLRPLKETIQEISENNTRNRAQLKWMHPMGPKNFALTREKVREKEKREPTQSKMFVETRKGNKGKELDVETGKVIVCNIVYIIRLLNIIGQHCL
ncbi:unnamed protein product [Vicia faba]|uniref:Uncharacterized protein n=1 Tax=Vicia faba TaxID=3906 RepID=A0AAV0YHR5_VICFA|nr:unnamed protein product [Vicia faba]